MLEQGAGPGGPVESSLQPMFARLQPPVHLPRTDGKQLAFDRRAHGPSLLKPREPQGKRRLQPCRTEIAHLLPDPGQYADGLRTVGGLPPWLASWARTGRLLSIQQPYGIRAVIPTHPRHFI